ncbi:chorismate mutase [Candidatus Parcubacteria bacterium]|nr:chorismate mutase [Candidatus Parcubacteria bacterium]
MEELKDLRQQIDKTDKQLFKVLAKRFALTQKVGEYKNKYNLKPQDKKREKQVFTQREEWAKEFELDSVLAKGLFKLIIKKVCQNHKNYKNHKRP